MPGAENRHRADGRTVVLRRMPAKRLTRSKPFRILGIETSCDETSVAILSVDPRGAVPKVRILRHAVSSQVAIHAKYGGVVPEVAARSHVPEVIALLTSQLGSKPLASFDAIAVTKGPGLATALRVGITAAQTFAYMTDAPMVGVNHLEGHLASAWLLPENRRRWRFPMLALLVSGGHTEIVLMKDFGAYRILGSTRDDAAGEAFDKTAKLLGLEYPGGPKLSKLAEKGNVSAYDMPRPMMHDPSLDMSFSGLKSHVRRLVGDKRVKGKTLYDLAASIEQAIVDVLVAKTMRALDLHRVNALMIVGGVSANRKLREDMAETMKVHHPNIRLLRTPVVYSTDNAAMIAAAGAWRIIKGERDDWKNLDAEPGLDLGCEGGGVAKDIGRESCGRGAP